MTANDQTLWETEKPIGGFETRSTARMLQQRPQKG